MFWLFDNSNKYTFNQIFPYYTKYKDSGAGCINWLYNFNILNITDDITYIKDIKDIKPIEISYTVVVKDDYIQYSDTTETLTWQTEYEFIKDTDELNNYKMPFFKWRYNLVDNHKMPTTSIKNYDYYYSNALFKIYEINENKLFIIEQINDDVKKYILEKSI